jgi:2-polyprenyl-3-methyl-5-hydroxy-6-metoxy-1,4-benzoquinol methylase
MLRTGGGRRTRTDTRRAAAALAAPPEMKGRAAVTTFDDHERNQWAGKAAAYRDSFASLCAHPAGALLDAAGVGAGVRVLDVGTGIGTVAALACARAATVTAVDAEPSMLAIARRQAPYAEMRNGLLPHLPFPDASFDAVVANFVINHVGDPGAAAAPGPGHVRPGPGPAPI